VSAPDAARADEADVIFDDSEVLTYQLSFSDPDWWEKLLANHKNPEHPYIPGRFQFRELVIDPIGVRLKGNSSFQGHPGVKKPFKLKFDEYDPEQRFYGLKKVNLNNSFKDPTMLREKLFLDFINSRVPAMRANHVRLEIHGDYWGLYVQVEQVDKTFFRKHVGPDEDGNLFKGDPRGTLEWLGPNPAPYKRNYELKTNEQLDDWSDLIHLIDVLNNTPQEQFPAAFDAVFEVRNYLINLAANMLFANLDAYNGTGHNYYVYHREDNDKFIHFLWDCNEAFGNFNFGMLPQQLVTLDPHWLPHYPRPLCERLWGTLQWDRQYLRALAAMLRTGFDSATIDPRINELADLIRPHVYADNNKMFTNEEFERNLEEDVRSGPFMIPGLKPFVADRHTYMDQRLDDFASRSDLVLNELMSVNVSTIQDNVGDYDPWLEIHNLGPGLVHIQGVFLSDDPEEPDKWPLPVVDLDDGQFLMLWIDGEPGEGPDHANFTLQPSGGDLYLHKQSGDAMELIDTVTYPALTADISFGRFPDGGDRWHQMNQPTPGAANLHNETPVLFINEFMADNETIIEDPDEPGAFEDWIEIYNPGELDVDMSGMYLTDDLADPTKWKVTESVVVPAGGFLLFWADDEPEQGPTHTNFKLSKEGEEIGLFDTDENGNEQIDTITFGPQTTDESFGRYPDGDENWEQMNQPTPGEPNRRNEPMILAINEFMADNETTIEDPDEPGAFEDWIEFYNPRELDVDMSGMYLTDDLAYPTQWKVPDGVVVPAGGFLLFWADDDPEQGPTHTNFKLSKEGEQIGLFDTDENGNAPIDTLTFGPQGTDISQGRCPDGADNWVFFDPASPGETNALPGDFDCDEDIDLDDYASFAACLTGPAGGVSPGCASGDFDGDDDVDLHDVAAFQTVFTGPKP